MIDQPTYEGLNARLRATVSDFDGTFLWRSGYRPQTEPGHVDPTLIPLSHDAGLYLSLKNPYAKQNTSFLEAELSQIVWLRFCDRFREAFADVWGSLPRFVRHSLLASWINPDLYARLRLAQLGHPRTPVIEIVDDARISSGGCLFGTDGLVLTLRYAWLSCEESRLHEVLTLGLADAYFVIDAEINRLRNAMVDIPMDVWQALQADKTEYERNLKWAELCDAYHLRRQEATMERLDHWGVETTGSGDEGIVWLNAAIAR